MILVLSLTFVALGHLILAQSCDNYGVYSTQNGTCTCPPGFGGETCALAACGGTIFQGTSRQYAPIATSGLPFSNITSCGCQDSWSGLGCNGMSSHHDVALLTQEAAYPDYVPSSQCAGHLAHANLVILRSLAITALPRVTFREPQTTRLFAIHRHVSTLAESSAVP